MPWFKISDDWLDHPKVQRAGKNGRALWVAVGNRCAKYSSDGWIEGDLLKGIAALAEAPLGPTTKKLVELKLWHDHAELKKCHPCMRDIEAINAQRRLDGVGLLVVKTGDYYFHDWAAHQLSKRRTLSTDARMAEDRSRALRKDTNLVREIQARDKSLCRYCGRRVNWSDRRGPARATYDHIDPFCFTPNNGNFLEGVVVACGPCNSDKGQRTAEEWAAAGGHTLKPAGWKQGDPDPSANLAQTWPGSNPDLIQSPSGSNPDLIQTPLKPDPGPSSPHVHGRPGAPLGPGQVGLGPGPGPGQIGPGRHGPGMAGLVRAGAGRVGSAAGASSPSPAPDLSDGSNPSATDVSSSGSPSVSDAGGTDNGGGVR